MAFLALVFAMGGFAVAANQSAKAKKQQVRACVGKKTGALRVVKGKRKCGRSERQLKWNRRGPRGRGGSVGAPGATGPTGPQGPQGPAGAAAGFGDEAAGGALAGTYPNPSLASGAVSSDAIADSAVTRAKLAADSVTNDSLVLKTGLVSSTPNSNPSNSAQAPCPSGTTVIAGAAAVYGSGGLPLASGVALSYSGIIPFYNGWYVSAFEPVAYASNWSVQALAICLKD